MPTGHNAGPGVALWVAGHIPTPQQVDARALLVVPGVADMTWIVYAMILGILAIGVSGYRSEKKLWNGGQCFKCQAPWRGFDMDSQGGRGYKCMCQPYLVLWVSYPGID